MSVTDEIKERLDIVEVISAYVPLKKAGRSYQGLCPFHTEKTPSFVVFPDSQSWHCFGACGTGGDVFTFIQKRENLDFAEALKLLAARAGVTLQPRDGPAPAAERHAERLREIVASTAGYFQHLLVNAEEAGIARDYLGRRGLLPETWQAWQLGYSLDRWDALRDHLAHLGYQPAEMAEAGVVIEREDGSGYYDRFRGRLVIPIRDVQGRAIGFGARMLREDPGRPQPKYINSPQTPLFDKSSVLFGLDMARKAIREANLVVLVEGYMDVLMSHQVGVRNVVAGMGTALTEQHMRQLKRYTSNVTLALDPDAAGDHATLRGLEMARQTMERQWLPEVDARGLVRQESRLKAELRIATLPDGLDPDELALADTARWRQVIADAQPVVDYYLALVSREEDLNTAHGKARAVERLAPLIREIAHPIERNHYIQRLARLVQTDERLVTAQVNAAQSETRPKPGYLRAPRSRPGRSPDEGSAEGSWALEDREPTPATEAGREPAPRQVAENPNLALESHILAQLLARPDLAGHLDSEMIACSNTSLMEEDFAQSEHRAILAALQAALPRASSAGTDAVLDLLPEPLQEQCLALMAQQQTAPGLPEDQVLRDLVNSVLLLRERNLRLQVNRLRFLMMESQAAGEAGQLAEYGRLMGTYTVEKRRIQRLLNDRTMAGALSRSKTLAKK